MPSTKELRRRIKSIKNTSQITKAMQMVSANKMRKAQNQALGARPYSATLSRALTMFSGKVSAINHPLLVANNSSKAGIILMTTDKGLCGALNSNLFRLVSSQFTVHGKEKGDERLMMNELTFYTIGKKGRDFVVRMGKNLEADFESQEHISFAAATKIRKFLLELFFKDEIGEVYLLYPHFISTLRQEAMLVKILPIESTVIANEVKQSENSHEIALSSSTVAQSPRNDSSEFLFEPNTDEVLDFALTHLLDTRIYQVMLEMKASEHSARMVAMKNATDNAKDLVSDLSLTYNQMRQNSITRELLEIASAGAALES